MNVTAIEDRREEYPSAVGHALGYLLAIGSLPLLAQGLAWNKSIPVAAALILAVAVLRTYLGTSVRDALSQGRAKAVMNRVDQAAIFLFIAGAYTAFALDALREGMGWAAFMAVWAVAALGCSVRLLGRARHTWFSSSMYLALVGMAVMPAHQTYQQLSQSGVLQALTNAFA
jgi:hemolysin III